jgi:imidazole glycerol phosphate synthase glutamine amidotransferase subunit
MKAAIIDTGCANVRSMETALQRAGLETFTARTDRDVIESQFVVLPGVGSFGSALEMLEAQGMADAVRSRIASGAPTLSVCVGLQLLGSGSEESPDARGLGVFGARAERFAPDERVPHMGWNLVRSGWLPEGHAYFANSYRFGNDAVEELRNEGWQIATTWHGGEFVAAMRRGKVLACQFHPELSGSWGEKLLRDWIECGREAAAC